MRYSKTMRKIITHPGIFHADEVSAIALLLIIEAVPPGVEIARREPTLDDLNDPDTIVLDIGGVYNPSLMNFDHHHDASLPSTNLLVLEHFKDVFPEEVCENLKSRLFNRISDVDRGIEKAESWEFNALVRGMNGVLSFESVLDMTKKIIDSIIVGCMEIITTQLIWNDIEKITVGKLTLAYYPDVRYLSGWKTIAERDNVQFLVCPSQRGGWSLISIDSTKFPIPPSQAQTFLHNNRFIAAYETAEEAINHFKQFAA